MENIETINKSHRKLFFPQCILGSSDDRVPKATPLFLVSRDQRLTTSEHTQTELVGATVLWRW